METHLQSLNGRLEETESKVNGLEACMKEIKRSITELQTSWAVYQAEEKKKDAEFRNLVCSWMRLSEKQPIYPKSEWMPMETCPQPLQARMDENAQRLAKLTVRLNELTKPVFEIQNDKKKEIAEQQHNSYSSNSSESFADLQQEEKVEGNDEVFEREVATALGLPAQQDIGYCLCYLREDNNWRFKEHQPEGSVKAMRFAISSNACLRIGKGEYTRLLQNCLKAREGASSRIHEFQARWSGSNCSGPLNHLPNLILGPNQPQTPFYSNHKQLQFPPSAELHRWEPKRAGTHQRTKTEWKSRRRRKGFVFFRRIAALGTTTSPRKSVVESRAGRAVEVGETGVLKSQPIRHMTEDDCIINGSPLPKVISRRVARVMEYCTVFGLSWFPHQVGAVAGNGNEINTIKLQGNANEISTLMLTNGGATINLIFPQLVSVLRSQENSLKIELDSLHGQASVLAAVVSVSPKLPLGYPARLSRPVLQVSKKMLTESSRNLVAATIEKESGWLLLSSVLSSMPKEELEDEVFDILTLWAPLFGRNPEEEFKQIEDFMSRICVWSAVVDALTAFIKCFVSRDVVNNKILLQTVIEYLNSAPSYVMQLESKELANIQLSVDIFIIKTLVVYQSLPDPMAYKSKHSRILQLCTIPYRDASRCEENSCLKLLLDKRDAWLGPWIPGRDWFEDELRAFQGGKDGLMPCVWENEVLSFPQPETIRKTLVNQMLLCFGIIFASQDNSGMLHLLGMIEQRLKAGKRQAWHGASLTNICVGLLAGLKALIALRPQPLGSEILNAVQAIFQSILAEGDICASQSRASTEGFGLLAHLGHDVFTARMTRLLLGDLTRATDSNYAGSIAFALGCIHHSARGMALSSLVPPTVSSISSLAKSTITGLHIWSLRGLLLTIEAFGFSYVSHVQATLGLAMDILLSEENGLVDLQQGWDLGFGTSAATMFCRMLILLARLPKFRRQPSALFEIMQDEFVIRHQFFSVQS